MDVCQNDTAMVALSVSLGLTFGILMFTVGFICCAVSYMNDYAEDQAKPSRTVRDTNLITVIDEKLLIENKLNMSLDEIVRLTRLRERTQRRLRRQALLNA